MSMKYDPVTRGKPADVLPMWVADMDFATPPCVTDALANLTRHGIFGYSEPDAAYCDVLESWFLRRFGWQTKREWLIVTCGVVNALFVAVRALTEKGAGVVIQQPLYPMIEASVRQTGRKLLVNELIRKDGRYTIDFDDFEEKIKQAELFILCNPHNPVGRVWTLAELTRMGEICLKHGVPVVSDEIWQDFVYGNHKHYVFAGISPELADITITTTAPSKTFNIAALHNANVYISNETMRKKFAREYYACGLSQPNVTGMVACKAAYEHGEKWLEELLDYIGGNMDCIDKTVTERLPQIKFTKPEGTYMAWLDCAALGLGNSELDEWFLTKPKLWLSSGHSFGMGGGGFMRMNTACPRATLDEALTRLADAVNGISTIDLS